VFYFLIAFFLDSPGSKTTLTQQLIYRHVTRTINTVFIKAIKTKVWTNQQIIKKNLGKLTLKNDKVIKF